MPLHFPQILGHVPSPISYLPDLKGLEKNFPLAETPDLATWKKVAVFGASVVGGALFAPAAGAGLLALATYALPSLLLQEAATVALGGTSPLVKSAVALASGNLANTKDGLIMIGTGIGCTVIGGLVINGLAGNFVSSILFGSGTADDATRLLAEGAKTLVTPAKEAGEEAVKAMGKGVTLVHFDDSPDILTMISYRLNQINGYTLEIITPATFNDSKHLINQVVPKKTLRLWQFESVEQGEEFMALANNIDLLISDGTMPGAHGLTLLERLVETHPALPKIFFSGDKENEIRTACPNWDELKNKLTYFIKPGTGPIMNHIKRTLNLSESINLT